MDHFAGLDVSVKETSICIVDDAGKIVREVKVASEPVALLSVLTNPGAFFCWTVHNCNSYCKIDTLDAPVLRRMKPKLFMRRC